MVKTKEDRYENEEILNRYIWLHYDSRMETFRELATLPLRNYLQEVFKSVPTLGGNTIGVDLGCAVGRSPLPLSKSEMQNATPAYAGGKMLRKDFSLRSK